MIAKRYEVGYLVSRAVRLLCSIEIRELINVLQMELKRTQEGERFLAKHPEVRALADARAIRQ